MKLSDVQERLDTIRSVTWDDERAHGLEDDLYHAVLSAIADGTCEDPVGCARLALTTKDIEFARWCA